MRILLIEDHPLVRESLSDILRALFRSPATGQETGLPASDSLTLEVAESASVAAYLFAKQPFPPIDWVLMDFNLSTNASLSGWQAFEGLRALIPGAKFLLMSAHADEHLREQAERLGAKGFLQKSLHGGQFLAELKQHLLYG